MNTTTVNPGNVANPVTEEASLPSWRHGVDAVLRFFSRVGPYGQSVVLLSFRLLFGFLMAQAGWGKLQNVERVTGFYEHLGLWAPEAMVYVIGGGELLGGVALLVGFATRAASAGLAVIMVGAYFTAHTEGFQSLDAFVGEAPAPYLLATVVLLAFGAGKLSLDTWIRSLWDRLRS